MRACRASSSASEEVRSASAKRPAFASHKPAEQGLDLEQALPRFLHGAFDRDHHGGQGGEGHGRHHIARRVSSPRVGAPDVAHLGEDEVRAPVADRALERPAGDTGVALQFYAQACGLTAAEERVLRLLSEGLSPREIASGHGVALSTVRTQIGSIRSKTGACSLTDPMRTLGCLPPIMPVAMGAC